MTTEAAQNESVASTELTPDRPGSPPRFGPILAGWMALVVLVQAAAWLTGVRGYEMAVAVDRGAAEVEGRIIGEVPDDVIRKAIQTQRDTLIFWATLAAMGDFVIEPLSLTLRSVLTATLFAGLAALSGRPTRFDDGLAACARAQGFWVLGLALRVTLMIALRRTEIETSPTLLLPPGTYPATTWIALRQLDAFALLGWTTMAVGGWRRGQTSLFGAVTVCAMLWMSECIVRIGGALILGAGTRMTLIPD